ncbi:hypothetical protein N7492_005411 [Penicillium capsulatum]|uniref:Zn(2)-C6 fungal-type domain-containing protein n=1 Tax=Penicillium capsulatum TaxID=69766 RepID=A0A9W9IBX7_9EURO|nr:hypothetical protein N7492_005411 [Penicillium capsulatum]KAJ6135491.1 hypothetical protein N7512_000651 [Penicillium capsulatum]
MVYGGKPSTGCYLCRKRKIKCDEARPECRNCGIYGRPCPGYRPDAVFRNENRKIERQAQRDLSLIASNRDVHAPTIMTPEVQDLLQANFGSNPSLTLHPIADATWQERAICYFFDQYTIPAASEEGMGHLEYLPGLYGELGNDNGPAASCLRFAVEATSLMTLANVAQAQPLVLKARGGYSKALRCLQDALCTRAEAVKDETFASVVLLSLFEDITGERNGLFSSHTPGFEHLMKLRGEEQLHNQRGREMFNFARTHTYVEVLALGDKPRGEIEAVMKHLNKDDPVESLVLAASKLSKVFLQMQSAPKPPDLATVESWISAGRECDFELSQWTLHLPDRWLPMVVYSPHGEQLLTYNRISHIVIWNYYRAARIMLQQLLLRLNRTLTSLYQQNNNFGYPSPTENSINEASLQETVQEITSDLCRSLPFSVGDIDTFGCPTNPNDGKRTIRAAQGFGLLWPLWYVLSCGMPSPVQINQIRLALYRIGSTMGINLALTLAHEAERISGNPMSFRAPSLKSSRK